MATVARPPERDGEQQVEHAFRLLDNDAPLRHALEAEQAHPSQPGIDVGQDVEGFGHLGYNCGASKTETKSKR